MNLFTKQTHRLRKQSDSYQRGKVGGGGINQEFEISIHTLLCIKWITNTDLLYSTGNCTQYFVIIYIHIFKYICTHTYINIYVCMFVCIPYVIVSCSSNTDSFILLSFSSKEIRHISSNKLEYRNAAAIDTYTMNNTQFSSVAQLCLTLCNSMDCSMPGLPVHHQLTEFTQIHVY